MDQVYRLIQESMACYQKLMEIYQNLRIKISSGEPFAHLNALLDQSREINKVVQYVDARFQRLAIENKVVLDDLPLFSEWKNLLDKVQEENRLMRRYAKACMAIVNDELVKAGQTKKALSGYIVGKDERGRQVNICSA